MEPNIWGPPAWLFLHTITFNYPNNPTETDKLNYIKFFEALQFVIPCPICREHYTKNIIKIPIRANSRDELIRWLIDIHNSVNISSFKPTMSYDEVYGKYDKLYNKVTTTFSSKNIKIALLLIVITIVIGYIYKMEK